MPSRKRTPKPPHPGGRPRTREQPSVVVTTRLDKPIVEALDEWAEKRNLKRSPAVAECVRRVVRRK